MKSKLIFFWFICIGLLPTGLFVSPSQVKAYVVCPLFSSENYSTGQCECNYGYVNYGGECISKDSYCKKLYGYNAQSDYGSGCKCSYGYVLVGNECEYGSTYCSSKYGFRSNFNSLSNTCECSVGSVLNSSRTKCVSEDEYCQDLYGSNAESSIGGKCQCRSGYVLSGRSCVSGDTYCNSKYGIFTTFNPIGKTCECSFSHVWNKAQTKCITKDDSCKESYGGGAEESLGKCVCSSGFIWNTQQTKCIDANKFCEGEIGDNSEYDFSNQECTCSDDYVLNDSEDECIEEFEFCLEKLGENSTYIGDRVCGCESGYIQSDDNTMCIDQEEYCEDKLGDNSEFIGGRECGCIDDYEIKDGICQKVSIIEKVTRQTSSVLGTLIKIILVVGILWLLVRTIIVVQKLVRIKISSLLKRLIIKKKKSK